MGKFLVAIVIAISVSGAEAADLKALVKSCSDALLGHPIFNQGQTVADEFVLGPAHTASGSLDRSRISVIVDNLMMNRRNADVYEIAVTPEQFAKYAPLFSRRLSGKLKVLKNPNRRFVVGTRMDYDAEIIGEVKTASPLNPRLDEIAKMAKDTPVSIEGVVNEIKNGGLLIDTGSEVVRAGVVRRTPRIGMVIDPQHDVRFGSPVQPGDRVRVWGLVYNGQIIFSAENGVTLL